MEADCRLLLSAVLIIALITCLDSVSLEVFVTSDRGSRKMADQRTGFKAVTNTDLVFTCEVSGMESTMYVQIIKVQIVVTYPEVRKQVFSPRSWPFLMTNRTTLSQTLRDTGRYRATETASGSVTMVISSTQPEDSGLWACQVYKDREEYMHTEVEMTILGPIQGLHLRPSNIPPKNETFTKEALLESKTGQMESVSCTVFLTNWAPKLAMFTSDVERKNPRDVTKHFSVEGFPQTSFKQFPVGDPDSPLRIFLGKVTYRSNNLTFNYWDHKRRLYCRASGDLPYIGEEANMELFIEFQPVEARCDPPTVFLPPGAESATLTCSVLANPQPEVTWMTGGPLPDNSQIVTVAKADRYTSTITLPGANASNFGVYKMTAKNELGETAAYVTLTEGKSIVSSVCCLLTPLPLPALLSSTLMYITTVLLLSPTS